MASAALVEKYQKTVNASYNMTKTEEKKRIEADKRMQAIKEKYLTMKKILTKEMVCYIWNIDRHKITEIEINEINKKHPDILANFMLQKTLFSGRSERFTSGGGRNDKKAVI